ncbi:MAG: hypothetical protein BWZ02_03278 [Lentisphaerae bacterium ADurb.BinA184]|nr:MAG: hypothetical protein BWZ02_03278 [Lentisphaerae bacterium ADurb.BinA184]
MTTSSPALNRSRGRTHATSPPTRITATNTPTADAGGLFSAMIVGCGDSTSWKCTHIPIRIMPAIPMRTAR